MLLQLKKKKNEKTSEGILQGLKSLALHLFDHVTLDKLFNFCVSLLLPVK